MLILLFRPFGLGDFVEAGGVAGAVQQIGILTTVLTGPDNRKIIVHDSRIMGGTIVNYSANDTRRVDLTVGGGYGDDLGKAKGVLEKIVKDHPKVIPDPAPVIEVAELGDSSANFVVRPWVKTPDYWEVYFDLTRTITGKASRSPSPSGTCISTTRPRASPNERRPRRPHGGATGARLAGPTGNQLPPYWARRVFLSILPTLVFAMASTNSTRSGTA